MMTNRDTIRRDLSRAVGLAFHPGDPPERPSPALTPLPPASQSLPPSQNALTALRRALAEPTARDDPSEAHRQLQRRVGGSPHPGVTRVTR